MDRREALARLQKATITTTVAADGMLDAQQSRAFLRKIKDADSFGRAIRQETRSSEAGEINKLTTASRIVRAAAENADDGYRAEATFPTVPYSTVKVRLPWEVTEDVFHENIAGQSLESDLVSEMTDQFALDLSDLDINGDDTSGDPFVQIDDGLLIKAAALPVGQRIDASAINSGQTSKAHFFAALSAMPAKYRNAGRLAWFMSPGRALDWIEYLTDRATGAGDAALSAQGAVTQSPLSIPIIEVPSFPDTRMVLTPPRNLVRVVSWQVRKRKVTGETDWELATRDKRGYIFFIKRDFIIEEDDAVIDVHTFDAL